MVAPHRDEIFKQKVNDCVQHIIMQKFTNFHAIRSWSFRNICNEIGWPVAPFLLRHPVSSNRCLSVCLYVSVCVSVVLEPYKYAGYPMLIKTITMETRDDALFSKSAPLLSAATELCYHTVNCSALNAEELRRERGIEVRSRSLCCPHMWSRNKIECFSNHLFYF